MNELRDYQIGALQLAEWYKKGDSLEAVFYAYGPKREAIYANLSPRLIDPDNTVRCVRHTLQEYDIVANNQDGHQFLTIFNISDNATTSDYLTQANITLRASREDAINALLSRGEQQPVPVAKKTAVQALRP